MTTSEQPQKLPPVRVHAYTLTLAPGEEPSQWYASCTSTVWLADEECFSQGCNWYGQFRDTLREARSDAARHRRDHVSVYRRETTTARR